MCKEEIYKHTKMQMEISIIDPVFMFSVLPKFAFCNLFDNPCCSIVHNLNQLLIIFFGIRILRKRKRYVEGLCMCASMFHVTSG